MGFDSPSGMGSRGSTEAYDVLLISANLRQRFTPATERMRRNRGPVRRTITTESERRIIWNYIFFPVTLLPV